MPKSSKTNKPKLRRLDSLFTNFVNLTQKDDSNSPVKRNLSDFKDKSDMLSSTYKNGGGLYSIKEDKDLENSNSSDIMDKPIRSLTDMYTGIRKDLHKRKRQKKKAKIKEEPESDESYDTCQEEEEIEMLDSQKQILEDKVYNLITHWNDMEYIQNHHEAFLSPEKNNKN